MQNDHNVNGFHESSTFASDVAWLFVMPILFVFSIFTSLFESVFHLLNAFSSFLLDDAGFLRDESYLKNIKLKMIINEKRNQVKIKKNKKNCKNTRKSITMTAIETIN